MVAQKHGTNALKLQRILELGSYQTSWTMLHKLRRAMVRPGRDKLQGMGTLQGSCSKEHFSYYLDEYTFRYNRRKSKSRGLLFLRLLENAVQIETTTYKQIINHNSN